MPKIITIHQPQYLPWIPYFDKILRADEFVLLDDVQFQKNGLQNRNQIKTSNGTTWLTIPVRHDFGQLISQTPIADKKAALKHLKTLEMNYKKAPFFDEVFDLVAPALEKDYENLSGLNEDLTRRLLDYLGYTGRIVKSSELKVSGKGSDLILNICKALNADVYISGSGGRNYMQLQDFDTAGIDVVFQAYHNAAYTQLYPKLGFIKDLSLVDLLFNHGRESPGIIEKGREI